MSKLFSYSHAKNKPISQYNTLNDGLYKNYGKISIPKENGIENNDLENVNLNIDEIKPSLYNSKSNKNILFPKHSGIIRNDYSFTNMQKKNKQFKGRSNSSRPLFDNNTINVFPSGNDNNIYSKLNSNEQLNIDNLEMENNLNHLNSNSNNICVKPLNNYVMENNTRNYSNFDNKYLSNTRQLIFNQISKTSLNSICNTKNNDNSKANSINNSLVYLNNTSKVLYRDKGNVKANSKKIPHTANISEVDNIIPLSDDVDPTQNENNSKMNTNDYEELKFKYNKLICKTKDLEHKIKKYKEENSNLKLKISDIKKKNELLLQNNNNLTRLLMENKNQCTPKGNQDESMSSIASNYNYEEISNMENENKKLKEQNSKLVQSVMSSSDKINNLKILNDKLNNNNTYLKSQMTFYENKVKELNKIISEKQNVINCLRNTFSVLNGNKKKKENNTIDKYRKNKEEGTFNYKKMNEKFNNLVGGADENNDEYGNMCLNDGEEIGLYDLNMNKINRDCKGRKLKEKSNSVTNLYYNAHKYKKNLLANDDFEDEEEINNNINDNLRNDLDIEGGDDNNYFSRNNNNIHIEENIY